MTCPSRMPRTASATGSLWSSPSTSTVNSAVIWPAVPFGPLQSRAGAFQQARQLGEHAGRVAARGRRLAGGQPDLAQRQAEPGDAVHQQQHGPALVAEMLGDGHRRVGRLPAQQRRRVRGGDHHDRTRQPVGAQVVLEEFAHFAPAFADQGQHRHVAVGVAGQHGEQGGLADAGAGEQAEALALAAGGEAIERANAEIEPRSQPRAGGGFRRGDAHRARASRRAAGRRGRPAAGPAGRAPGRARRRTRQSRHPARCLDGRAARTQAIERVERHGLRQVGAKADDLGRDAAAVTRLQQQAVADRQVSRQAVDIDNQAGDAGHATGQPQRRDAAQGRAAGLRPGLRASIVSLDLDFSRNKQRTLQASSTLPPNPGSWLE